MNFATYQHAFRNIAFERADGILDMRLHTNGGSLQWGHVHAQLAEAFHHIGRDPGNRVLILRGSGKNFCAERNLAEYPTETDGETTWHAIREARDILVNLLEIEVPIISLVHGPATIHPELPAMADIVLAAPEASFQDSHIPAGIVPGDGAHVFWTSVLGPTRAAHFFFTERVLTAEEALQYGVVHEIHPREALLPRARALAERLATKPTTTLRYTRMVVHQALRERMAKELALGLTAEFLGMAALGGHPSTRK